MQSRRKFSQYRQSERDGRSLVFSYMARNGSVVDEEA